MDDIALNPDYYDLFREPVLVGVVVAWLGLILLMRLVAPRKVDIMVYLGAFALGATALDPVLLYARAELPLLAKQTALLRKAGSADALRERDPLFGLLQIYLKSNPATPLVVIEDETGETERWAAYYLAPRPIVRSPLTGLAGLVPESGDASRWVLAKQMPPMPEGAAVSIEGRVDDWLLIKLSSENAAP